MNAGPDTTEDASARRAHTLAVVITNMSLGDSLSQLHRKTGMNYVTVRNAVEHLASLGFVETQRRRGFRGREKIVTRLPVELASAAREMIAAPTVLLEALRKGPQQEEQSSLLMYASRKKSG